MPRRGPHRITVIGVGTPPQLPLRPLAMEVLRILEAKQSAEREAKRKRQEDRAGSEVTRSKTGSRGAR